MFTRKLLALITTFLLALQLLPAQAAGEGAVKEMEEYLEFVDYGGATILPEQIPAEDWKRFFVIDARDADQYAASHIPGAVNIEWRQVLARRAELSKEKAILIYCNTGSLSAQAGFALRVAGMDNVRILQGGFSEWKSKGGFEANRRYIEAQQKAK
ncbi:MAG TPA: rhodanese-like domain-containing protein [Gallionellaceae bacterium]